MVIDQGILTRDSGQEIREQVIEKDRIETVITLPEKLFYNTDSPGCIIILNKEKPPEREGKIQFIYAEEKHLRNSDIQIFEELSNQNELTQEAIKKISHAYHSQTEEEHHSSVVDVNKVLENDANLSVERYVDTTEKEEEIQVPEALQELRSLEMDRKEADEKFSDYITSLPELGLDHNGFQTINLGPREMSIPEHWEKVRLDSVTEIITRGKQPDYVEEGGIPVLNQSCIYWDGFHPENLKRLDEESASEWKDKYFVKNGDVLINSTGQGTLGRAIEWTKGSDTHALDSHITRVHPDEEKLDSTFFRYYLESNHGQTMLYVYCVAGSTGQIELSKTDLQSMPVILPPIEEQEKIAEAFRRVRERLRLEQEIQEKLQDLNKGLLQDLLTGRTEFDADRLEY